MIVLNQEKVNDYAFKFLDKNGNLCGSVFTAETYSEWIINPCFPVSEKFSSEKMYLCKSPSAAKTILEKELNSWLKTLKEDI